VATAFFLQGFNMRRAFALFDIDGDGEISAREFRQGMAALNLHLRYDEIDDLMRICDMKKNNVISYDEFISKMDKNMKRRSPIVQDKVEKAFIEKLTTCIEYSRDSLYTLLADYDVDRSGKIELFDLPKVIKKLGIMNPNPNLGTVLKLAGVGPDEKRIAYGKFARDLQKELDKRRKEATTVFERLLEKIVAILRVRGLSIFDFFVQLDVNASGKVSWLEFKTGVQHLGLDMTPDEFRALWDTFR
jgi:Ca2+-binding EF-hand superfamily protein